MKKEVIATLLAVSIQFFGVVWYISKLDSKVNILYDKFEKESEQDVIENQVKMKLDLANLMKEVEQIKRDLKQANKKDKTIMKQHEKLFELIEGNNSNSSNYSYGD